MARNKFTTPSSSVRKRNVNREDDHPADPVEPGEGRKESDKARRLLTAIPSVLIVMDTRIERCGGEQVCGILKYAHLYGPWKIQLFQGRMGERPPRTEEEWRSFDGFIVGQTLGLEHELLRQRKPVVLLETAVDLRGLSPSLGKAPSVVSESEKTGKTAAEYFLAQEHTHYAYVHEVSDVDWSRQRGAAFCNRLAAEGFDCHVYPPGVVNDPDLEELQLGDWLKRLPFPVALLASRDSRAHQIAWVCRTLGIRVPQDIAVLGVDNDVLLCNGNSPTLSSIQRVTEFSGMEAARLLDEMLRGESFGPRNFYYSCGPVIERESTRLCPQVSDPLVRNALEYIHVNACKTISVPDIVDHVRTSRRLLELRFKRACGHTILTEIQKVRLQRVVRFLGETDLSIEAICDQCGYSATDHLRRLFSEKHGCTMTEYRQNLRNKHVTFCANHS